MRELWSRNGLSIITFTLFSLFWAAMGVTGFFDYNSRQEAYGQPLISLWGYFTTGHFWEATFENWESEYLQMGLFVLLTAILFQKGSAESKSREEHEEEQREEEEETEGAKREEDGNEVPAPVRMGGWVEKLYENSLSIALLGLFLLSFVLHAAQGVREYNQEQLYLGQPPVSAWRFLATSEFWFQSFQNWQSEFLAVGSMVVLTIYLRQKGSAESKRVGAPSGKTGE